MSTSGFQVDERSLEKVLKDLKHNLSKKEMRKILNKGTKAGAAKMKRAIIGNAPVPAGKVVKIRAMRNNIKGGLINGHQIFIGTGAGNREGGEGSKHLFDIPAVWAEYGTYNQRDWQGRYPYVPETLKRHPDANSKNLLYPAGYGIRATFFIRKAYDATIDSAATAMFDAIEKGVKDFKVSP